MEAFGQQTLVQCLEHWVKVRGDRPAFTFLDTAGQEVCSLSFAELQQRAQMFAGRLDALGLRGEHAALMFGPGLDFVVAFLACLYADVVAVPIYPAKRDRDYEKMRGVMGAGSIKRIVTNRSTLQSLKRSGGDLPNWIAGENLLIIDESSPVPSVLASRHPDPERLAMLQYTSGSTALPKGVMITHRNLISDLRMLAKGISSNEDDVYACWLPHYHDMGLIAHLLSSLYSGCHCLVLAPAAFINRPLVWLETINRYRVSVSGAPNFAYRYCVDKIQRDACQHLRLDCWKVAMVSAEPVRQVDLAAFTGMFSEFGFAGSAFTPGYGLAEACVFVTGSPRGEAPEVLELDPAKISHGIVALAETGGKPFVGCGFVTDEQELVIVEPETRNVVPQALRIGEVWVAGDNIMKGYWNDPQATEDALVTLANRPEKVFLRTGDLGFLDQHSNLFITGRIKDLIIVRGVNLYPQDIEEALERLHPDLRPGANAAFAQEGDDAETVVVVAELKPRGLKCASKDPGYLAGLARSMSEAIAEAFQVTVDSVAFLRPGGAIKTSSGKISRQGCKKAFLKGELKVVGIWRRSDEVARNGRLLERSRLQENLEFTRSLDGGGFNALSAILGVLGTTSNLGFSEIDLSKSLFFYGVDSLKIAEIHGAVEAKVGCSLSPLTFFRSNTLKGLIGDIAREILEGSAWIERESRFYEDAVVEWQAPSGTCDVSHEVQRGSETDAGGVMLTGGAGFFGSYLLHELLARTTDDVFCLVRAGDEQLGMMRILSNASSYGLNLEPHVARIHPVLGDISKPTLGLSEREYARLSESAHQVFHCAAIDNFYLPYESLRPANVEGVKNVAQFAAARRVKPLFYTSSCAAALFDEGLDRFELGGLICGYSQTKYVAERFVRGLIASGFPATYYRIGYLYSSGCRAIDNEESFETLLESMYHLNCVPEIDAVFDLTSVEYATKCIVDTALLSNATRRGSYTLYNPVPLEWRDLLEQFRKARPGIRTVSLGEFQEKFRGYAMASSEKRLRLLRSVVNHQFALQINAMFGRVTPDVFEHNVHLCPPCDPEFSAKYLELVLQGAKTSGTRTVSRASKVVEHGPARPCELPASEGPARRAGLQQPRLHENSPLIVEGVTGRWVHSSDVGE